MGAFGAMLKSMAARQKLVGTDVKGWLGNGWQELQQAFVPGVQQIQPGDNPTLGTTVTSGEVTNERRVAKDAPEQPEPDME
ncbi:hypothetical protein [Zavarzinella formosa]|uniref:hypothetical protein n=1 Tax=Zavarzinella formosa TaxID=360055 RepID=UPI0002D34E40|nr:hypothetical protein [Zavarzinella formosa]